MYTLEFMFEPHQKDMAYTMLSAINKHNPIESGVSEQRELINYEYGAVWRYIVWSTWIDDSKVKELKRIRSIIVNAH